MNIFEKGKLALSLANYLAYHDISKDFAANILIADTDNENIRKKLDDTLLQIYFEPEKLSDFNQWLRVLSDRAMARLGFDVTTSQSRGRFATFTYIISNIFALIFAPLSISFLIFMIVAGASNLTQSYGMSPYAVLVLYIFLIVLLAALEGSQISIVSLRVKDVSGIEQEYPLAAEIQRKTKKQASSQNYLAGRQFFVIFVVFLIAQATSFPKSQEFLPDTVSNLLLEMPIFQLLLLELGFLGAFVTLWFGQLAPQFYANKNPQKVLNFYGMKQVVNLCFVFESLGFARPGSWLITKLKSGPLIPISDREVYDNLSKELGYSTILQEYIWKFVDSTEWNLNYKNVIGFKASGITQIKESGLEIYGESLLPEFSNSLKHKANQDRSVYSNEVESVRLEQGWHSFSQLIKATHGSFLTNETVVSEINVKGKHKIEVTRLSVTRPTKLLRLVWKTTDKISFLSPVTVKKYKYDDNIELLKLESEFVVDIKSTINDRGGKNTRVIEFIETYPKIGTFYEFSWRYE